jgi:hypothetical protein
MHKQLTNDLYETKLLQHEASVNTKNTILNYTFGTICILFSNANGISYDENKLIATKFSSHLINRYSKYLIEAVT